MLYLRQATQNDAKQLTQLIQNASWGLTSLPKDPLLMEKKLSMAAYSFDHPQTSDALFTFVLEESTKRCLLGTSALKKSDQEPKGYFLQRDLRLNASSYPTHTTCKLLEKHCIQTPSLELCGLFLHPKQRHQGAGKLLSLARLFFLLTQTFDENLTLFADIRGHIDDTGTSPFWDRILGRFSPLTFQAILNLYIKDPEGLTDLLPSFPIYQDLLPKEVQKLVGRCHKRSIGAFNFLRDIGLQTTPYIHPLDGGPRLEVALKHLAFLHQIKTKHLDTSTKLGTHKGWIARKTAPFMAGSFRYTPLTPKTIALEPAVQNLLDLQPGDPCLLLQDPT